MNYITPSPLGESVGVRGMACQKTKVVEVAMKTLVLASGRDSRESGNPFSGTHKSEIDARVRGHAGSGGHVMR